MPPSHPAPSAEAIASFFPVPTDSLERGALGMDLYLKHAQHREPALYRAAGVPFTAADARRLAQQNIAFVYIPMQQHGLFRTALRERLDKTFRDPRTSRAERTRTVRAACSKMIEDVMLFPGQPEAVEMVAEISRTFSEWSRGDGAGFGYLLDMSAHDFYTITHMMNVGVGCGMLYAKLRPDDAANHPIIIQGGMLHDVGKRNVPEAVLNKEGKLGPEEWALLRAHPRAGYDELRANPAIPPLVLEMTRDHHEKLDGSGYPAGLKGDQIGLGARVCAVVDVYDAITAARPYRGPISPGEALAMMAKDTGTHFDPEVFAAWRSVVETLVKEDPGRAVAARRSSDETRPQMTYGAERRHYERLGCALGTMAMFVRKGKDLGPAVNDRFPIRILDVSRGGLRLRTDFPMTINDLLAVSLPSAGGQNVDRLIRIVRVRRDSRGRWAAGGCFVAQAAARAPKAA